jgi:hypothetical protein
MVKEGTGTEIGHRSSSRISHSRRVPYLAIGHHLWPSEPIVPTIRRVYSWSWSWCGSDARGVTIAGASHEPGTCDVGTRSPALGILGARTRPRRWVVQPRCVGGLGRS